MLPATRVDASSMHLRDMDVVSSSAQSARGSTTFQRRLGLGSFSLTCAIRTRPSQPFSRRAAGRSQVHLSGSLDQADGAASERRDDGAVHCNGGGTENQDQSQSWATSPPHRHCCEAHPTCAWGSVPVLKSRPDVIHGRARIARVSPGFRRMFAAPPARSSFAASGTCGIHIVHRLLLVRTSSLRSLHPRCDRVGFGLPVGCRGSRLVGSTHPGSR